jgi:hypothetical protein
MVEFAMVSFVLYLLFVVLLDLGRATLASQTIQNATDLLANELARAPLPASMTFDEAMEDEWVNSVIYDPRALVLEIGPGETQQSIDERFARLPVVNQMLRPLMVRDVLSSGVELIRYPGALVERSGELSVVVPQIVSRDWGPDFVGGHEEIVFRQVMEEIHDPVNEPEGHFAITSGSDLAGFVNLRCNYPYQAAAMTAYPGDSGVFGPENAAQADDSSVTVAPGGELPPGYTLAGDGLGANANPNGGEYGLGFHYLGTDSQGVPRKVRPYRKLIHMQAAARREIVVPE